MSLLGRAVLALDEEETQVLELVLRACLEAGGDERIEDLLARLRITVKKRDARRPKIVRISERRKGAR